MVTQLRMAGETFSIGWLRTDDFASPDATTPVWISSGLALLTLAIAGVVSLLQHAKEDARELVEKRTREFAEAQRRMTELLGLQQAILDGSDFSIISTDTHGMITSFNAGAEKLLGYRRDEMVNRLTPEVIHLESEIVARSKELTRELEVPVEPGIQTFSGLASRGKLDEHKWTYVRKDGRRMIGWLTISAILSSTKEIIGYLSIAQDLTARKLAEASRKAALAELSVLKQALDLHMEMSVTDAQGRI